MALDKHTARELLKGKRASLDEKTRAYAALKLGGNISAFFDAKHLPHEATVGAYWPLRDEIDVRPALSALMASGAHIAYPCVHEERRMEFYLLSPQEIDERPPAFLQHPGRSFPASSCAGYLRVEPCDLDVVLVPGLGFDHQKHRLGSGAGCYDRYLARVSDKTMLIGVAYDEQLCEALPVDAHDVAMHFLVTPNVII
jgi:5-formyltetrahydrofolate cyclo-ligase